MRSEIRDVEKYLRSLKAIVSEDYDLLPTTFEIVTQLELKLDNLSKKENQESISRSQISNRKFDSFFKELLSDRESYEKEIDSQILHTYISYLEADLFDIKRKAFPFKKLIQENQKLVVAFVAILMIAIIGAVYFSTDTRKPVWEVELYEGTNLDGQTHKYGPIKEIDFDWLNSSPIDYKSLTKFSMLFRTCITVKKKSEEVTFNVTSDDGFRYYVDMVKQHDNWRQQAKSSIGLKSKMGKGPHLVEFHYFDAGGLGSFQVELSTEEESTGPADDRRLYLPTKDESGSYRCL